MRLTLGTGPLDQLLARALLFGLPSASQVVELRPDQSYEFQLRAANWSDGTPVTLDDYLLGWEVARGAFTEEGEGVYRRTEARILHTMQIQVLDARRIRISLPQPAPSLLERLDRWPFLPRHRRGQGTELLTHGPYQLRELGRGRLELVGAGRRVQIEEVAERPARDYDVAFVLPTRDDPAPPTAGLWMRRPSDQEFSDTLAVLFPGYAQELVAQGVIAAPDRTRTYPRRTLGYSDPRYAGLAQGLAIQLHEAGRDVLFVDREATGLHITVGPTREQLAQLGQTSSGRYFPITTGSQYLRSVDRKLALDATDGAAFVRWPLRWER